MQRSLLALLLASLLAAGLLSPAPVGAGTEAAPEITDPANDQVVTGANQGNCFPTAGCVTGTQIDLLAVWFTANAADLHVFVKVSSPPASTTQYDKFWDVSFKAGATAVTAGAKFVSTGALTPTGAATGAALSGAILDLTVPRTALAGAPALTDPFAIASYAVNTAGQKFISDRAPDGSAFGSPYSTAPPGGNNTGLPGDRDGDGLQDTFEEKYFNNATSPQAGSGDPDADGLNNTQEQTSGTDPTKADTDGDTVKDGQELTDGTDPTKADTDGDGFDDGAEKAAGTDPKNPVSHPVAQSSSTTSTTNGPRSISTTSKGSGTSSSSSSGGGKFGANGGYAGASAGAALVLIALCLVALFGRWAL